MTRTAAVVAVYALIAALVIPVFPHFISPNEFSRWVLAAALVERRSIEVTPEAAILGPRFEDLAEKDGRLYSNKPPGLAALSLPGYLAVRPFAGPPSAHSLRPALTAMRWLAATAPLLLLAFAFLRAARVFGIDDTRIATGTLILLFATPLFAYGLLLFSHAVVAAALFGAWAALFAAKDPRPWRDYLAGALIGGAVTAEYTAAIPAAVLVILVASSRRFASLGRVVAAGIPFALALAAYHAAAFGSPTALPYFYERLPQYRAAAHAFFGVDVPTNFLRLLLDPGKGLLVFSPVLVLAIPGFIAARKRMATPAWLALVLMPLTVVLLHAGYPNWHGGWTTGPRYILGAVPFLAFALLFRDGSLLESVLTGWSVCAVTLTAIVFPFVPNAFPLPWSSLALPLLADGLIAPNLLHLAASPLAVAMPLVLIAAAMFAASQRRKLLAIAAGIALAIAAGSAWPMLADRRVIGVQRAYLADVYFEQTGTLEAFAREHGAPPGLFRRRALERQLPPSSWPF